MTIVEEANQKELVELVKIEANVFEKKTVPLWILGTLSKYGKTYAVKEKKEIIGSAYCMTEWAKKKTGPNVYLIRFFINEERRNKGHGTFLIGELLKNLKQEKFSRVKTRVDPKNIAAIQVLCNHYGFNGTEFLLNEEGKGEHRLLLNLNLDRMTFRRGKEKKFYVKRGKKDALSDNRMLADPNAPAEIRRLIEEHYICKGAIKFKGKNYLYFTKDLTYI
ncbi:MAG: GNAT family N-acetyltransferase [Euryarchaeota archaeon]|nr:GNAT family N-acetyltransferase [Euryarchaeota archaeon]